MSRTAPDDAAGRLAELETLYQASPVGLCAVDRELRYVRANEEYAQIVGRPLDQVIGRSMHEVVHEVARPYAVGVAQRVIETGEAVWNAELPGVSRTDPPQPLFWLANVVPLGPPGLVLGAVAVLQNVTALRQAEQLARSRLEELESLYRNVPIGLAFLDRELRYVRVNPALAELNGRSPEEHVGVPVSQLLPELRDDIDQQIGPMLESGASQLNVELRARPPGDPEVEHVFLASYEPVRDEGGEVAGIVAAVHDVTERVRAQEEAERAGREAAERLAELEALYRSLEAEVAQRRSMEAQQRLLLRELDHRVKNTLASVQALADLTLGSSDSLESFENSFQGRLRAMATIHEALAGERTESLELARLVEMVLAPFASGERLSLAGPPWVLPPQVLRTLGMALHELATNAAKHGALSAPDGRVEVSWYGEGGPPADRLVLCWRESGGPPPAAPVRRGFGATFLEEGLAHELGAAAQLELAPEGMRCRISLPSTGLEGPER